MQHFDYIILGAGISGLTFGRLLQLHAPGKTFLILEKESEPGGLCRTQTVKGVPIDTGGGHFLYSKHKKVYDFIFNHISQAEFRLHTRDTKIWIHEQYIDYPIENNLWQLPKEILLQYVDDILPCCYSEGANPLMMDNMRQFFSSQVGNKIYENYLRPYNLKLWGLELAEMGTDWLNKLPKTAPEKIIKSIIFKENNTENIPSHEYFYYPKYGGFQRIIDSIAAFLINNIELNTTVKQIIPAFKNKWIINNKYSATRIINTVPWSQFTAATFGTERFFASQIGNLRHTSLVVSVHREPVRDDPDHNWHWTYLPDMAISSHREFYPWNYSDEAAEKWTALYIQETNRNQFNPYKFKPGSLVEMFENEYAYPVPTKTRSADIGEILRFYAELGLYGLGRWGQWQHFNSDVCIYEAMNLLNHLEGTNI